MRIIKCNITNFGCYYNKTFEFNSNLNSFCYNNGEGKTTLAAFIKAMLYSLEKSSTKSYERKHYKPYRGGEYGGSIEIEYNDKIYRIERTFGDSPTKDTLKIYDENGISQDTFLSNEVSLLQGEASSKLGELILGIDVASFQKCNFISSNDLDFLSSESIKMKIGNIVIDRERENSYEDTYDSIYSFDLREKAPTRKNENAYPFRIKELEKINKQKQDEINELKKLEDNLNNLYNDRDLIKLDLDEIEEKQRKLSLINIQKGKLSVLEKYNFDISKEKDIINSINIKYNNNVPSLEEADSLSDYIKKYEYCTLIDSKYEISQENILRLQNLNGRVISDEDLSILADSNSKINGNVSNSGLIEINLDRYQYLKDKFQGKELNNNIDKEYYEYNSLIQKNNINNNSIKYPDDITLDYVDNKINEYNNLNNNLNNLKESHHEKIFILKLILIIVTFGIYYFISKNNNKKYENDINELENNIKSIKKELEYFFSMYNLNDNTYDIKMIELKDKIKKQKELDQMHIELLHEIDIKKNILITYFSIFGYNDLDIEGVFKVYKKELEEYKKILNNININNQINKNIKENKEKQIDRINNILNKYNLIMEDDFSLELDRLKNDLEFYKKYNPIYLNKIQNDKEMKEYKDKIISILNYHDINDISNIILVSRNIIEDAYKYQNSKKIEINLMNEKNDFIRDNNLNGFVVENVDKDEEELRNLHELKSLELKNKEEQINQNEINIARKDILRDEIDENNELIANYKQKIEIAQLALESLENAHFDMEAKFISPIKNSFISYAKRIYEKIGSNVNMDYDYVIKYDVNGQLREAKDLSDGERAIMMLALRFAVLDSMYKNQSSFIILDDPFDSLDSIKLNKAISLIKDLANDWQIIYFTCHDSRKIEC